MLRLEHHFYVHIDLRHQYGISVAGTISRQRRGARRDGCFYRLVKTTNNHFRIPLLLLLISEVVI